MYVWKMREMPVGSCSPAANVRCAMMMMTGSVFCFAMGREDSERKRQAAAGPHFETEILYR